MARDGAAEAQTSKCESTERSLNQHRGQSRPRVEQSEEADEVMTCAEIDDGLRLEEIVNKRAQHCRQCDHQREIPQEWLLLELRPRSRAVWGVRDERSVWRGSPADGDGARGTESAGKR